MGPPAALLSLLLLPLLAQPRPPQVGRTQAWEPPEPGEAPTPLLKRGENPGFRISPNLGRSRGVSAAPPGGDPGVQDAPIPFQGQEGTQASRSGPPPT